MRKRDLVWSGLLAAFCLSSPAFAGVGNGRIAYNRGAPIYWINPDGSAEAQLGGDFATQLSWAPDGQAFAFVYSNSIYTINLDGTELRQYTDQPSTGGSFDYGPAWSPDGTQIAFSRFRLVSGAFSVGEIYVADVASGSVDAVTVSSAEFPTRTLDVDPSWSPDSGRIVFTRYPPGGALTQLYIVNDDGTGLTPLTSDSSRASYSPRWSPDGSKMLFGQSYVEIAGGGYIVHNEVHTIRPDGTADAVLPITQESTEYYVYFSWSPDGTKIVGIGRKPTSDTITIWNADGSNETDILTVFPSDIETRELYFTAWQPILHP